jgi:release factor glutamine methyltransferase
MAMQPPAQPTVRAQLDHAEHVLASAGLSTPREDALALLGTLLGVPTAMLLVAPDRAMSPADVELYASWIACRAAGEATPHITGHLAFMDLDLIVGRTTPLVPGYAARLVELALESARRAGPAELLAADLGTGCGAVALALAALEPRFIRIYAVDPSLDALRTAAANGARYLLNLVIAWLEGEGLDVVPEPADLIVRAYCGQADASLFARLLARAPARLRPGGALVCGFEHEQDGAAAELLRQALPEAHVWAEAQPDGVIVVAQLPPSSTGDAAFDTRR